MTRRVLAALLGITVALLAGVVVPLGVISARHDRQVFLDRAQETADTLADRAEDRLGDSPGGDLTLALAAGSGLRAAPRDHVAVYDPGGRLLLSTGSLSPSTAVALPPADRAAALQGGRVRLWRDDPGRLTVAAPVRGAAGAAAGLVVLTRPSSGLSNEVNRLWWSLSAVSVVALAAAVLLAVFLARWVSRPLHRLEVAAAGLAGERLTARAETDAGPDEVRQLAATFNRMAARLEELVEAQRSVTADVSHQLRTPLAALRLRLELLRQDVHGATATEIDGALAEVSRLSRLLDGLLAVARAENTEAAPVPVDLRELTADRIAAWIPVADEAGLELCFADSSPEGRHGSLGAAVGRKPAVAPLLALSSPGTPEQVLDNLLANALEATPAPGRITVSVRRLPGVIQVVVADTGPGMTEEARARALRRYWSGSRAQPTDGGGSDRHGSGLGLAIVDRLLAVDGGSLRLQDAVGGGLAAVVELPAAAPRAIDPEAVGR